MIKKFFLTLSLLGFMAFGFSQFLTAQNPPFISPLGCGGCCPDRGADMSVGCKILYVGSVECLYMRPDNSWYSTFVNCIPSE
ncbi:MAG: hypothetical protein QNK37_15960 [Acidobacteriota bacterium]|nr:hypothetical protein [Acidobacteriota bacterium]